MAQKEHKIKRERFKPSGSPPKTPEALENWKKNNVKGCRSGREVKVLF